MRQASWQEAPLTWLLRGQEPDFTNHSYLRVPQGSLDHPGVWIPTCPGNLPLLEEKIKAKSAKRLLSCLGDLVTYS